MVPAIGREPSPTGTQRRADARSLRRNSTESSIPRFSRDSVESVHSKALEVPKLNEPRPPSRNNSRSSINISDGSTTSLQTSESSDTRDFADAQTDMDNTINTPTGPASHENSVNNLDPVDSHTSQLDQEGGPNDSTGLAIDIPLSAANGQKEDQVSSAELEKREFASATGGEEGKESDKSLQPEMPGSFD